MCSFDVFLLLTIVPLNKFSSFLPFIIIFPFVERESTCLAFYFHFFFPISGLHGVPVTHLVLKEIDIIPPSVLKTTLVSTVTNKGDVGFRKTIFGTPCPTIAIDIICLKSRR